jgi:hypothetical protein
MQPFLGTPAQAQAKGQEVGSAAGEGTKTGLTDSLKTGDAAIDAAIADLLEGGEDDAEKGGEDLAGKAMVGIATGLMAGRTAFPKLASEVAAALSAEMSAAIVREGETVGEAMARVWGAAGGEGMASLAQGIEDAQQKPVDAYETMLDMIKNAITPAAEAQSIAGKLMGDKMNEGLRSKNAAVRAQAMATAKLMTDRFVETASLAQLKAELAGDNLKRGLSSKNDAIRHAAEFARNTITQRIDDIEAAAATSARNAGSNLSTGLRNWITSVGNSAWALWNAAASILDNPLPMPSSGGRSMLQHGGMAFAGGSYIVGEAGPELFVPMQSGVVVPHGGFASGGGGGGTTIGPFTIINPAPEPASVSIKRRLQSLAAFGFLGD